MRANNFAVGAVASGLSTVADDGTVLDARFPRRHLRADIKQSQTRRLRDHEVAGVAVTWQTDRIVKAVQLSGQSNLLFRHHSISGRLEALDQAKGWAGLDPLLHGTRTAETQFPFDSLGIDPLSCPEASR